MIEVPPTTAPGDSREQRDAEAVMVAALSGLLSIPLAPRRIDVRGAHVLVDAASDDLSVVCEAWAHQGAAKAAQVSKVLKDAFKLAFLARVLTPSPRLILLFSDEAAAAKFRVGWARVALDEFGIETVVVEVPPDVRESILQAQQRQFR